MDDLDTLLSGADQQPTQDQQTTAPSAPQDLDSILQKAEPTPPAQDLDTLLQKAEGGQLHSYQGTGFKQGDSAHLDARNPDVYQKFLQGFAKQESDNRYGLIGPPSSQGRALGKYQITQAELNQLHAKIGITNNPQEFLNSPDQQEKAMASLLSDKINRYGGSIEDIILDHYGGPGAVKSYHNYLAGKPNYFDYVPTNSAGQPKWIGPSHKNYLIGVLSKAGFTDEANAIRNGQRTGTTIQSPAAQPTPGQGYDPTTGKYYNQPVPSNTDFQNGQVPPMDPNSAGNTVDGQRHAALPQLPKVDLFASNPSSVNYDQTRPQYGKQFSDTKPGDLQQPIPGDVTGIIGMTQRIANSPEGQVAAGQAKIALLNARKAELERVLKDPETNHLTTADITAKRTELSNVYSALKEIQNPKGEIPDMHYGSQSEGGRGSLDRQRRLTVEYNDLSGQINQGQKSIIDQQGLLGNGVDRINHLVDLINSGRQDLIPQYNDMMTRVNQIGSNLNQVVDSHNANVKRFNVVGGALRDYGSQTRPAQAADKSGLQKFMDFMSDAGNAIGTAFAAGTGSPVIQNYGIPKEQLDASDRAVSSVANFVPNALKVGSDVVNQMMANDANTGMGHNLMSTKEQIQNRHIQPETYNLPGVQFSQNLGTAATYLLPGGLARGAFGTIGGLAAVGRAGVVASEIGGAANVADAMNQIEKSPDPVGATKQLITSFSPLSSDTMVDPQTGKTVPVSFEERANRALNLFMLGAALTHGAGRASDALVEGSIVKNFGYSPEAARQSINAAKQFYYDRAIDSQVRTKMVSDIKSNIAKMTPDDLAANPNTPTSDAGIQQFVDNEIRLKSDLYQAARQAVEANPVAKANANLSAYVDHVKGAVGSKAGEIAQFYKEKYDNFLATPEGQAWARNKRLGIDPNNITIKPGQTGNTAEGKYWGPTEQPPEEVASSSLSTRPETGAPELPGKSGIPASTTHPVDLVGPDGTPSGYKLQADQNNVHLINADGGVTSFPYNPADAGSYKNAIQLAKNHAANNPATNIEQPQSAPKTNETATPVKPAWSPEQTGQHSADLAQQNPNGVLKFGGQYAGQPVSNVPLGPAQTLLTQFKQHLETLPEGESKAQVIHDVNLLQGHVDHLENTAKLDEAIKPTEESAPSQEPQKLASEPSVDKPVTLSDPPKLKDAERLWNTVQQYPLTPKNVEAINASEPGTGKWQPVEDTGWHIANVPGGIGLASVDHNTSFLFPASGGFGHTKEDVKKRAIKYATDYPAIVPPAVPKQESKPESAPTTTKVNIIQNPSGKWGYVGKVPHELGEPQKGGTPQIPPARQSLTFDTPEEAEAFAKSKGFEPVTTKSESKPEPKLSTDGSKDVGDLFDHEGHTYRVSEIDPDRVLLTDLSVRPNIGRSMSRKQAETAKLKFNWPEEPKAETKAPSIADLSKMSDDDIEKLVSGVISDKTKTIVDQAVKKASEPEPAKKSTVKDEIIDALKKDKELFKIVRGDLNNNQIDNARLTFNRAAGKVIGEMMMDSMHDHERFNEINRFGIDTANRKDLFDEVFAHDNFKPSKKEGEIIVKTVTDKPKPTAKEVLGIDGAEDDFAELGNILGLKEPPPTYDNEDEVFKATGSNQPTPERKALGERGLGRLINRYGGTILGQALVNNFVRGKSADLVGQTVGSPEDLAVAAQILRNPEFEVSHWVFLTPDHEIKHADSFSVRLPSVTSVYTSLELKKIKAYINQTLEKYGATYVALIHNHPTGHPKPSQDDIEATIQLANMLPNFQGHIVINSVEFAYIDREGVYSIEALPDQSPDKLKLSQEELDAQELGMFIGLRASTPKAIAAIAKKAEKADQVVLIARNTQNQISAIARMPLDVVANETSKKLAKRAAAWLSKFAKVSGGGKVTMVMSEAQYEKFDNEYATKTLTDAINFNMFSDVVIGPHSIREYAGPMLDEYQLGRKINENIRQLRETPDTYFEQDKYEKAKPIMDRLFTKYEAEGKTLPEFVKALLGAFSAEAKPYIVQFLKDKRDAPAYNTEEETNAVHSEGSDQLGQDKPVEGGKRPASSGPDTRGERGNEPAVSGEELPAVPAVGGNEPRGPKPVDRTPEQGSSKRKRAPKNFRITDEAQIGETTDGAKKRDILAALELRNKLKESGKQATPEQMDVLAKFPGTGWTGNRLNESNSVDPAFRDALKALVTADEWANFTRSTVNSHYTSIPLIDAHWDIAKHLGFKGGPAIETSAGIGHFLGRAPKGVDFTAVEFEGTAADILKLLYPEAKVIHAGFQDLPPKADQVLAISNIPFAIPISDPKFEKELGFDVGSRSHNYFFAKALDHLVDGGLIIFTTSAGTLNAGDAVAVQTRKYLESKADFIGAIRLPNNAFSKNAGTDVTTDIVILRKRPKGQPIKTEPFVNTIRVQTAEGDTASINEYFVKHPEMVLGEHSMRGKMYGRAQDKEGNYTSYTLKPTEGADLGELIQKAIAKLPKNIIGDVELKSSKTQQKIPNVVPPKDLRVFRAFFHEGKPYLKVNDYEGHAITKKDGSPLDPKQVEQLQSYIHLRTAVRDVMAANKDSNDETVLGHAQSNLKKVYDQHVKTFKRIGDSTMKSILQLDEDYPLVKALEIWEKRDKKDYFVNLAPIFDQRIMKYSAPITKVDNPVDAMLASLHNLGKVDMKEMQMVSGLSEDKILEGLKGKIFEDPATGGLVTADEYGSGNVRDKWLNAQELTAIKGGDKWKANEEFLKGRQPKQLSSEQIFVQLGSKWVPVENYNQFIVDTYGVDPRFSFDEDRKFQVGNKISSEGLNVTASKVIDNPDGSTTITRGGESYPFHKVLDAAMNNKPVRVLVDGPDDTKVFDAELTSAVNEKIQEMRDTWDLYWKVDDNLSKEITKLYNENVNVYQYREYDGSFLDFPGSVVEMNGKPFNLRPWQKNMIFRNMSTDFNYAAHGVGTGKTFEIVASTMELRRIAKRNKIAIVTLKANKKAIVNDFLAMYPDANILMANENSMTPDKRKEFLGRIVAGNYDAIIMHHDQFKKIPISPERADGILVDAIEELRRRKDAQGKGANVKSIEKSIAGLEAKLKKQRDRLADWQDVGIYFEDLGIDHLMVDEAHYYRKIPVASDEQSLADSGSALASDMLAKVDYLREVKGGTTFYSGTPVVNSISETYALFRFMAPEVLDQTFTRSFDEWRTMYAGLLTKTERDITGQYKIKSSFFTFSNLTEMKIQLRNFADVKRTKDVAKILVNGKIAMKLPRLKNKAGEITDQPIIVETHPNKAQDSFFIYTKERAASIEYPVVKGGDNVLAVATDNAKASIDMRSVDPKAPDFDESKINKLVSEVLWVHNTDEAKENRATQLIFLDYGTPKKTTPAPVELFFEGISESAMQDAIKDINDAGYEYEAQENADGTFDVKPDTAQDFNLYADIKAKLVLGGIPENEIAFIHDYDSDGERDQLYDEMNSGKMRILLASTKKGGVGVNVQKRLLALHNVDAPWTPADQEQRSGRGIRQGNMFDAIYEFNHITVNSFDGFKWNKLAKKSSMIEQLWSDDFNIREVNDDVLSDNDIFEMQAAIASGRQDILEYENVKNAFKKLQLAYGSYDIGQRKLANRKPIVEDQIRNAKRRIDELEQRVEKYKELFGDKFNAVIGGVEAKGFKEFGQYILTQVDKAMEKVDSPYTGQSVYVNLPDTTIGKWSISASVKWDRDRYETSNRVPVPELTVSLRSGAYSETTTISTIDLRRMLSDIDHAATGFATRTWNMKEGTVVGYGGLNQQNADLNRAEDELKGIEKNLGKPFVKMDEFKAAEAKFHKMDDAIGKEIRSGNFGQFGSGNDEYPPGYWKDVLNAKKLEKQKREEAKAISKASAKSLDEADKENVDINNAIFGFGRNPAKPAMKPTGATAPVYNGPSKNVSNFPNKIANAIYAVVSPQLMDDDGSRVALFSRQARAENAQFLAAVAHMFDDARKYFDRRPKQEFYDFVAGFENDTPFKSGNPNMVEYRFPWSSSPEKFTLEDVRRGVSQTYKAMQTRVESFTPDQQREYVEFYFGRIWKQETPEDASKFREFLAKFYGETGKKGAKGSKKLGGSQGFRKKRSYATLQDGLDAGLTPIVDNPIDMMMLKLSEMSDFIFAMSVKDYIQTNGISQFVRLGQHAPDGYSKVDSPMFDAFSPGEVEVHFAFDKKLFDGLHAIAEKLGTTVEYKNVANRVKSGISFGYENPKGITLRYGADLDTFAHELGHALDRSYGLVEKMLGDPKARKAGLTLPGVMEKELLELAKLRYESEDPADVPAAMIHYTNKDQELIANFLHAYMLHPELAAKFAPEATKWFKDFSKGNPILRAAGKLKGGLEMGSHKTTYKVFGRIYVGTHYVPTSVAHVLNNKFNPGLKGAKNLLVRKSYEFFQATNGLFNMVQLGLSGFHAMVTVKNVVDSQLTAGLSELTTKEWKHGLGQFLKGVTVVWPLVGGVHRGRQIINAALSGTNDPDLKKVVQHYMMAGGRVHPDQVYLTNFRRSLRKAFWELIRGKELGFVARGVRVPKIVVTSVFAMFEAAAYPLMQQMIPALKAYAFEQMAMAEISRLEKTKPRYNDEDLRASLAAVQDDLDNRFGEMVNDNLFMHNAVRETLIAVFRAPTWTIGGIRNYGGAAQDTIAQATRLTAKVFGGGSGKKPPGGGSGSAGGHIPDEGPTTPFGATPRQRSALMSILTHIFINLILTYLLTGKIKDVKDALAFRTGRKYRDGTDERMFIPSELKDIFMYMVDGVGEIMNKLSPAVTMLRSLHQNKDFSGTEIVKPDSGIVSSKVQQGEYVAQQLVPISMKPHNPFDVGANGIMGTQVTLLGLLGEKPAPLKFARTRAMNLAYALRAAHVPDEGSSEEKTLQKQAEYKLMELYQNRQIAMLQHDSAKVKELEAQIVPIKKAYPKIDEKLQSYNEDGDKKEGILYEKETDRFRDPIEIAMRPLGLKDCLEVYQYVNDDERKFARYVINQKVQKIQDEFVEHNKLPKDPDTYNAAVKVLNGKGSS